MIKAIRHTGIVVTNLQESLRFWCNLLGFKVSKIMEESGPHVDGLMGLSDVNVTTAKLAAPDGNLIELLHFTSHLDQPAWGGTPYSTGLTHIAFTVDNLDELIGNLVAAGVEILGPPQIGPDRYAKVIYAKGPEGVLLELVELLPQ